MKYLETLPDDLKHYIEQFIPNTFMRFINKSYSQIYNEYINTILRDCPNNLIRSIIRQDDSISLKTAIKLNYLKWNKNKKFKYKTHKFPNFYYYVRFLCGFYNANKCKEIMIEFEKKQYIFEITRSKKNKKYKKSWFK
ncbi:MAG: hypothetical protein CML42_08090 [Rhodobacteraceae bacterium]|nr:hypothetical protein [Paracoccaceae bacterium]|tara:strand:- start:87751 stop:88164 length:414 start_codon:yes stop_codon:yes gene_type:complete